jgi:hypothetical protein
MEMSQGNNLYSYLTKTITFFSFIKLENRRVEQVLSGGTGTSGSGDEVGKGCRRMNMVEILYTRVCKQINETIETLPGMGKRDKGE